MMTNQSPSESQENQVDEELVRQYAEDIIRNPALDGVDTEYRLLILFNTIHKETDATLIHCRYCREKIDSLEFSEEFIEAYKERQTEVKQDLLLSTASAGGSAVQQRWINFATAVIRDVIPLVDSLTTTDPSELNEVEDFPFFFHNGKIYSENCDHIEGEELEDL